MLQEEMMYSRQRVYLGKRYVYFSTGARSDLRLDSLDRVLAAAEGDHQVALGARLGSHKGSVHLELGCITNAPDPRLEHDVARDGNVQRYARRLLCSGSHVLTGKMRRRELVMAGQPVKARLRQRSTGRTSAAARVHAARVRADTQHFLRAFWKRREDQEELCRIIRCDCCLNT